MKPPSYLMSKPSRIGVALRDLEWDARVDRGVPALHGGEEIGGERAFEPGGLLGSQSPSRWEEPETER